MKIISFVDEERERAIQTLSDIAGQGSCSRKKIPFAVGTADTAEIRGSGIEKASVTHLIMHNVTPPELSQPVDYMVFQIEIFPDNPRCPMGHFNTEWALTGNGPYHMNLDLFPAGPCDAALNNVKHALDTIAHRYSCDPIKIREGLDTHYNMKHWDRPLAAGVGCKLMHLDENRLDFFIDAFRAFWAAYIDILTSSKHLQYSDADNQMKLKRNGKWLEYLTLKDPAVKMGLAVGIPPEVIIRLSYPPSAVF
ncbi:MAG: coproporphyrinogen III oxidase [Desulfobacterota bacterium]|nr:coproporphyrinogen III oxidase [Thermodesulfobacteriota bacterium]